MPKRPRDSDVLQQAMQIASSTSQITSPSKSPRVEGKAYIQSQIKDLMAEGYCLAVAKCVPRLENVPVISTCNNSVVDGKWAENIQDIFNSLYPRQLWDFLAVEANKNRDKILTLVKPSQRRYYTQQTTAEDAKAYFLTFWLLEVEIQDSDQFFKIFDYLKKYDVIHMGRNAFEAFQKQVMFSNETTHSLSEILTSNFQKHWTKGGKVVFDETMFPMDCKSQTREYWETFCDPYPGQMVERKPHKNGVLEFVFLFFFFCLLFQC